LQRLQIQHHSYLRKWVLLSIDKGILSTAGRVITILDHKALEQLAEGE
jgi:hypothetical protein